MIYCVEDDISIRELMVYGLRATGFEARGFANGESFFAALKTAHPDLVLLDIMLPGESGMTILKRLRSSAATKVLPVIMVSARGSEYDKVAGLESGADDYLAKPFGMMELVSRVKAVLRRSGSSPRTSDLTVGGITMSPERHLVLVSDKEVSLTPKEFSLLRYLMENEGTVVSRDRLLESVWGYDFDGGTRTVDVHVGSLRQKLGDSGAAIETVRGIGYRIGDRR